MPSLEMLIAFTGASLVLAFIPGPDNIFVMTQAAMRGWKVGVSVTLGLCTGLMVHTALVAFGVAVIFQKSALAFGLLKFAGAAYLLYLAYKLWTSRADPAEVAAKARSESAWRTVLGGFTLTLGNPKTIVFYMALLPSLMPIESITLTGYVELIGISIVTLTAVGVVYAAAAAGAREFFRSPKALRRLNRTAGTMMAGAAAAVVAR